MFKVILNSIRPVARSIKYGRLLHRAKNDAKKQSNAEHTPPVAFILGCGRSGTTILGKLLKENSEVLYLFEPYHLWKTVCSQTDMVQLYSKEGSKTHCILGAADDHSASKRFNACIQGEIRRSKKLSPCVIEKTPINAMRLPFLHSLSPHSKVLHIVRNGIDVVRSIERLSSANSYQMSGKGNWNQWWGRDHCKWHSLVADAKTNGWFADEVEQLSSNIEMGALEWLVSLKEIEKHRQLFGDNLIEIRYDQLTQNPNAELTRLCTHFGIQPAVSWLNYCSEHLDSARKNAGKMIVLPIKMCEAFNAFQEQYGFEGRATTA